MKTNIYQEAHRLETKPLLKSKSFGDLYEFENSDKVVRSKSSAGKTEVTCTCYHATKFCNNIVLCKHRIKAIVDRYLEENKLRLKDAG